MIGERVNDVSVKVVPYGAGWEDVYLTFGEQELYFVISTVMGDTFNRLLEVLYYLYPVHDDYIQAENLGNRFDFAYIIHTSTEADETIIVYSPEEVKEILGEKNNSYTDIAYKSSFEWCSEPDSDVFVIEREKTTDKDFDIRIRIKRDWEDGKEYDFIVNYRKFCYAVAKGVTDALLENGIRGYYDSVWVELNLKYFMFIKSVALGEIEEFRSKTDREAYSGEGKCPAISNLRKELELIGKEM